MFKFVIPAAIATMMVASSASALPAGSSGPALKPLTMSDIIKTEARERDDARDRQWDRDARRYQRNRDRGYHYVPGRRYGSAPRGWHRYHSRPSFWRTRGCIVVGPVWFCP